MPAKNVPRTSLAHLVGSPPEPCGDDGGECEDDGRTRLLHPFGARKMELDPGACPVP